MSRYATTPHQFIVAHIGRAAWRTDDNKGHQTDGGKQESEDGAFPFQSFATGEPLLQSSYSGVYRSHFEIREKSVCVRHHFPGVFAEELEVVCEERPQLVGMLRQALEKHQDFL